jgi:SAM-dependent methyltransferase
MIHSAARHGKVPIDEGDEAASDWVEHQDRHDLMLAPYGRHLLAAAALGADETVVDIGCGTGQTTVEAARSVTTTGRAVGMDRSTTMLAAATRRAAAADVQNIHFVLGDAESHRFRRGKATVAISRFGTLGFADPVAAFANLRVALAPGGRLCLTAWADEQDNAWSTIPRRVLAERLPGSRPPHDRQGAPFAFADAARIEQVLADAGYVDVQARRVDEPVRVGSDIADAVAFLRATAAAALSAGTVDEATRAAVDDDLAAAAEPFLGPGGVTLPAAAWVVTASRG